MSPATVVPAPVDASKPERLSPVFWIVLALVTLATLAGSYQWWLLRSDFAKVMYGTVGTNPRVRAEFGTEVQARALIGWSLSDTAFLFGPVWRKKLGLPLDRHGAHQRAMELSGTAGARRIRRPHHHSVRCAPRGEG